MKMYGFNLISLSTFLMPSDSCSSLLVSKVCFFLLPFPSAWNDWSWKQVLFFQQWDQWGHSLSLSSNLPLPLLSYWPQQLNFAVWYAKTGYGISCEVFDKVPEQIKSFLTFHFYFTAGRILFEMGGIQSQLWHAIVQTNMCTIWNFIRSRIPVTDFRFRECDNHGVWSAFVYVTNLGPSATSNSYRRYNKFGDDGGKAITGNLIYLTTNDNGRVERQFDFFMADKSEGLTQAGMAKLNQSIEAFVYCILGAQANVWWSILSSSRSSKGAQREFLFLVEDVIRKSDKISEFGGEISWSKAHNGSLSKINRLASHPSNSISKTSTEVQVKSTSRLDGKWSTSDRETNHDMVKVGLISAGMVSAFLIHRFFLWNHSTITTATPIIRSHAFWPRKLITDLAALNTKHEAKGHIPCKEETWENSRNLTSKSKTFGNRLKALCH